MTSLRSLLFGTFFTAVLISCSGPASSQASDSAKGEVAQKTRGAKALDQSDSKSTAIFAGGCFWCTESDFEKVEGVIDAVSGYIGGEVDNPSYKAVSRGSTGHTEAIKVIFDPSKTSFEKLVEHFWFTIDPTTPDRQFCDAGSQYRPGIFYLDDNQKKLALKSKEKIQKIKPFSAPLKVEITQATTFYDAEEYHQDFYKKSTAHYTRYRLGCGRDASLKKLWGDLLPKKAKH